MLQRSIKNFLKARLSPVQLTKVKRFLGRFLSYGKVSYSQYGEDIFLLEFFKDRTPGFYVDVGAFHPRQFSNTYALYARGWRGINIDGNPGSMDLFRVLRARDLNVETLVSDEAGVIDFASWGMSSENSADPGQMAGVAKQEGREPVYYKLNAVRLDEILDRFAPKNTEIDLLSVDVEGMDLKVLKSLSWEKYRPTIVLVESYGGNILEVIQSDIYGFMIAKGYELVSWYHRSLIFKKV